jgi:hypothetical protein
MLVHSWRHVLKRIPNTDWSDVVFTDRRARVVAYEQAEGMRAVRISQGTIRSAPVADVFELAESSTQPKETPGGKLRVEVKCLWYGRKPPNSWMHITILGTAEVLENYSGPVAVNIAR